MDEYEKNWLITEAMMRYGGSFVKGLGQLYRLADRNNQHRLRTAFPEYWRDYENIAKARKLKEVIENAP